MHNCEHGPPPPPAPATGAALLVELGQLIVHTRDPAAKPAERQPSASPPSLLQAKLLAARSLTPETPSTSKETGEDVLRRLLKIKEAEGRDCVDAGAVGEAVSRAQRTLHLDQQLNTHVQTLWSEREPLCISVLLANCARCGDAGGLLLERWTLRLRDHKNCERPGGLITSQWLLNAVRSQLHFSQISAWRAKLRGDGHAADPQERQRRRSRETCNYKKLESNCDEDDLVEERESSEHKEARRLNVIYRPHALVDARLEFSRAPAEHRFPLTLVAQDLYLEMVLESLPRTDEIPLMRCACVASKRRPSLPPPHDELVTRLSDLTLAPQPPDINSNIGCATRKLSIFSQTYQDLAESVQLDHPYSTQAVPTEVDGHDSVVNYLLVDDRMHTPCSESGKHRCSCDDESDAGRLDERRLKELAKHKRRMRKESRMRRLSGSEPAEPTTSIPILQASRFDRMRALGCYRSRGYVPVESPHVKRTATVSTQTDDLQPTCGCGRPLETSCDACRRHLVRSEASYDLAKASRRRERDESDEQAMKKHKCDDLEAVPVVATPPTTDEHVIKRPKLRRAPVSRRIERVVLDRNDQKPDRSTQQSDDIDELLLRDDDSVFAHMAPASPTLAERSSPLAGCSPPSGECSDKRSSSTDDEYVLCDYGTFDRCEETLQETPKSSAWEGAWETGGRDGVPSPREMEGFRWRLDSAASMVFHARTGLPLTSSPAPLRRGKSCFDYDSTITGISGIKSALFHPVSPPDGGRWSPGSSPGSPAPPPAAPAPPAAPRVRRPRRSGLSAPATSGLLGSFEESALNGRLEPVATVHGFTAELGASGAFCPPHRRLPVTVFFYALGGTNAPYLGHINLGPSGYRVPRSGTIQVSLLNPHGTLVKMFVVLYDLTDMPPSSRTFLRQRTLYLPCDVTAPPPPAQCYRWLRYLIHLRFVTSKSGKLYLHTDIRIIVSRKADLDTATAHVPLYKSPAPVKDAANDLINIAENQKWERDRTVLAPANHKTERERTGYGLANLNSERDRTVLAPANHKTERERAVLAPANHKAECERTSHTPANRYAERQKNGSEHQLFNSNLISTKIDAKAAEHSDRPPDIKCREYKSAFVGGRCNRVIGAGDEEMSENTNGEAHASSSIGDFCRKDRSIVEFGRYGSSRLETTSLVTNVDAASESGPNASGNTVESVSYELRSFTYAPDNPKYSPR